MTEAQDKAPDPRLPRAALVTGGARRIGAALVRDLAQQGWKVGVHYRASGEEAAALCREIAAEGGEAVALQADLRDERATAGLIEKATVALGPLGLLVNNASIFVYDDVETADRESWQSHLDINLRAPFVLTQAFAAALPAEAQGLVVNLLDARVWNLSPRYMSYTLSKSGLWTLTQTLAQALAPKVRVNGIGLGPTLPSNGQSGEDFAARRSRLPLQNTPALEEVAAALRFLIAAGSMTGQMVGLDGGDHLTRADVGSDPVTGNAITGNSNG